MLAHPSSSPYGYTKFVELFNLWADRLKITMRQVHKAGEKCFVNTATRCRRSRRDSWNPGTSSLSLLGGLLLKAGLTDSLDALSVRSLVNDDCEHEANRIRERRMADEDSIEFLVRQAMKKVFADRGMATADELAVQRQRRDREEQEVDRRYRAARSLPARPPGHELPTTTPGAAG